MRFHEIDDSSKSEFPNHWAAAEYLYRAFKPGSYQGEEPAYENWAGKNSIIFSVRGWGQWVVPDDAEDDGDYDWEVMTPKSLKQANDLIEQIKQKFPGIEIDWGPEEKNWLFFQIPLLAKQ